MIKMNNDIKYKIENVDEESNYVGNVKLPDQPKPGEYMICQICGKPILPQELSKEKELRKKEIKWHIHNECYKFINYQLDLITPGLLASRGQRNKMSRITRDNEK